MRLGFVALEIGYRNEIQFQFDALRRDNIYSIFFNDETYGQFV